MKFLLSLLALALVIGGACWLLGVGGDDDKPAVKRVVSDRPLVNAQWVTEWQGRPCTLLSVEDDGRVVIRDESGLKRIVEAAEVSYRAAE
jgi:hypothetical protein